MTSRPFAWERSYPPGLRWDAPIEISTLPALLDTAVAAHGEAAAIEYRGQLTTYADLRRQADRFAAALMRAGIGPGSCVALYLPNTPYHPVAFFGILRTGARAVHLSPLDAERELAHKLADSGARTIVTTNVGALTERARGLLEAGHADLMIVGDDAAFGPSGAPPVPIQEGPRVVRLASFLADAEPPARWPAVKPDDVALLQYTGGTTGMPKGAILSHANLTAATSMYATWFRALDGAPAAQHRVICVLPLFHIYALTAVMLRAFAMGSLVMLRPRFDPHAVLDDIERGRATHFPGVPTMWIALSNLPGIETRDFSSLIYCGSGGAPLPVEIEERFERLTGHRLTGGWGMTETAPAGTNRLRTGPRKPGTIGLPLSGIEMDVASLEDPTRRLGVGEVGELRIKGPNVTRGYWNRPDETALAFADGYFLTGDIGYMDEDGYFFIVDRKKDMIISGGFNVYPQTVEQAIYEHPAVEEVLVIGVPDPYRGEAAKAFVKLRAGAPPFALDALQAFLADKVGRHEMPTALEIRPALPRTAVGKLSKLELRAEERARTSGKGHPHHPVGCAGSTSPPRGEASAAAGALPLPEGERVGVRGTHAMTAN